MKKDALAKKDELVEAGKDVVKRKRNRPDLANFGAENAEPGDNSRFLRHAMVSWDMPPVDISDPEQVKNRITDYFVYCADNDRKPNMIGMANWLGVDRATVNSWKTGEYRASTHLPVVKKAVDIMEELWVDYMLNGKVNPASGIFLGKNMFGYKDTQDVVVTPKHPMGEDPDEATLAKRIEGSVIEE